MKKFFLFIIKFYQHYISPLKPACCRFYPTCSTYAIGAVQRFGVIKGGILSFYRILRCNPFNRGGFDPVPEKFTLKRKRFLNEEE